MSVQNIYAVLIFVAIVHGDVKPCCGPTKWTAEVSQTVGEYNSDVDAASLAYGNTTMYYDYDNRQVAYKQIWDNTTAGTVTNRRIVIKYLDQLQAKEYVIINQTCTKTRIKAAMDKPCIPDDSAFLGAHVFAKTLKVNVWLVYDPVIRGTKRIAVTDKTCLRATMSRVMGPPDYQLDLNVYQNVTSGISDPSVFDIPSFCHKPSMDVISFADSIY